MALLGLEEPGCQTQYHANMSQQSWRAEERRQVALHNLFQAVLTEPSTASTWKGIKKKNSSQSDKQPDNNESMTLMLLKLQSWYLQVCLHDHGGGYRCDLSRTQESRYSLLFVAIFPFSFLKKKRIDL